MVDTKLEPVSAAKRNVLNLRAGGRKFTAGQRTDGTAAKCPIGDE
jgi:hypothetical protein